MLSPEALNLFAQLLSSVQLPATDPDLVEKAQMVTRVRAELQQALQVQGQPVTEPTQEP